MAALMATAGAMPGHVLAALFGFSLSIGGSGKGLEMQRWAKAIGAIILLFCASHASAEEPEFYGYRVVNTFPHDTTAFTQGLFFEDGDLYETTGRYGQSRLRKVALESGETLKSANLSANHFGEGSVAWGANIIVLTWRSGAGFVFDRNTFERKQTFSYSGEGWGLTHDGERLIMSDGTSELRFLNPETFEETGRLKVTFRGAPLPHLNELEWVNGEILANVWMSDAVVRIDPETGAVTGLIDLRGLNPAESIDNDRVLNGIAYDDKTGRLFVTGKYWPSLFEIELVEHEGAAQ